MPIGEICNREVVIMRRDESLLDAARLMREQHVGDVVIVEEGPEGRVPTGIFSDRDLVVEVLAEAVPLDAVTVGDVMSTHLLVARETDEMLDTIKQMRASGVRRVPVINDAGALVGILTLDDLVELIAEQLGDLVGLMKTEQRHERELRDE